MIKKTPEIRFKGFSNDWEQRKLGEITERITRKNKNLESTLPLTISAQHGLVDQNTFFNKQVASKDVSNYYLLRKGEFAYNKSYSNGFPWGAVKRLDNYEMGVLSTLYITFIPTIVDSDFLVSYYDTNRWHREVSKRAAEGARNHGLLNIAAKDFFDTDLCFPFNRKEQKMIGSFFKKLDDTIALHQRKIDLLKQSKRGLLQKMFPKKGETVPVIRFFKFIGKWKQRKLGEMLEERNDQIQEDKEYPLMSFVQGAGVTPKSNRYDRSFLVKNDKKKYKKTELGDFIYSSNNLETGSIGFNKTGKAVISPVYSIFSSKNELESQFIGILSSRKDFINKMLHFRQGVVYGQWRINEKDFLNIHVLVPSVEEQRRLILFYENLDLIIDFQENKINHLQKLKKSLLQKMFI